MSKKIFISAGDPSGDIHAARLITELKKLDPEIEFTGIGGCEMEKAGFKSIIPIEKISVVGFLEVARRLNLFRKLIEDCRRILQDGGISAFIPVDYPGFNLRMCKIAKDNNIPVIYYIAPQLWAWGKERASQLAENVDKLLTVFPFEQDYFGNFGIDTVFVGHPLLDNPIFSLPIKSYTDRENAIAIFPGSRLQEISRHKFLLIETIKLLNMKLPGFKFLIAAVKGIEKKQYDDFLKTALNTEISYNSRFLMQNCKAGIIKTGTSTLESALLGMPFSMFYNTSMISYLMGKRLVRLPYLSMVNILSKKFVVNEFIQRQANPDSIAYDITGLIENENHYNSLQVQFLNIRKMLGEKGASEKAAVEIMKILR